METKAAEKRRDRTFSGAQLTDERSGRDPAAMPRTQHRMKFSFPALVIAAAIVILPGCATEGSVDPAMHAFDPGTLPPADIVLNIPGLGPCTDNPDRSLHLNSQQPVTVLVHGCFGSSGLFRGLAQVLAFHGQQTVCFTYNDRDSMMVSSAELISALEQLANRMANKYVTVIGYSQGALIARKALVSDRPGPITRDMPLRMDVGRRFAIDSRLGNGFGIGYSRGRPRADGKLGKLGTAYLAANRYHRPEGSRPSRCVRRRY